MLLTTDDAVLSETQVAKKVENVLGPKKEAAARSQNRWVGVIVGVVVVAVGAVAYALFGGSPPPPTPPANQTADMPDDPALWDTPATRPTTPTTPQVIKRTPLDPPPTQTTEQTVDYLWIQSTPPGGRVTVDGQFIGLSPVVAPGLADGVHQIRIELDGYKPLEREIYLPYLGEFPTYTMVMEDSVGLITSEPSGASVFRGSQLLGRTPLWLRDYPPGRYEFVVAHTGLERKRVDLAIETYRGNHAHVDLAPVTSRLAIRTVPADADVIVDGAGKGTSQPGPDPAGASAPLIVEGLYPGTRQVVAVYRGRESSTFTVRLQPDDAAEVIAFVWLPTFRYTNPAGKTVAAVYCGQDAAGDYILGLKSGDIVTVPATELRNAETRTIAEAIAADGTW